MRRALLFAGLIFFTTKVQATITFNNITGVSSFTNVGTGTTSAGTTATTTITAYGGTGGTACTGVTNSATCDSCDPSVTTSCANDATTNKFPLCACNPKRIYDGLFVTVLVDGSSSPVHATANSSSTGTTTGCTNLDTSGGSSTTNSVTFSWLQVCNFMGNTSGAGGSCESKGFNDGVTVTIYSDKNNDGCFNSGDDSIQITFRVIPAVPSDSVYGSLNTLGIGDFTPFPGDERVYIKNPQTSSTFTPPGGGLWTSARIFVSDASLSNNNATPENNLKTQDLGVSADGTTLSDRVVDGLDNDKLYFFRIAMVDQAGNILQYYPDTTDGSTTYYNDCVVTPSESCPYAVRPSQVLGMLSKDLNCFIATAAYGSLLEPKLVTFREFRNRLLLKSWGKKAVMTYYNYGPYAARFIADKPMLRAVVRAGLWPLFGFTWIAVHYSLGTAFAMALIVLSGLAYLIHFAIRRMRAGA